MEELRAEMDNNKQVLFTTFLLISPSLFLAALVSVGHNVLLSLAAIAVFAYQAIMIKNYVDKNRSY